VKIIFAKNIGFCSGVERAMESLEQILEKDPKPIQFLGKLIHNKTIIENIKTGGGVFISDPRRIGSGTLIIRAHGVAPFTCSKNVKIEDLTCPLVKKVQLTALSLNQENYQVVIIGDKNHAEVIGIKGYTKNKAIIVENKSQARKLKTYKSIGAVIQTTQNLEKVKPILGILKNKTKNFKWINTICPEVIARQRELYKMLKKVDGMVIIGSKNSANTKRLVEIIKNSKKNFFWINSFREFKKQELKNISVLGIVSGTSAQDREIEKIRKNYYF